MLTDRSPARASVRRHPLDTRDLGTPSRRDASALRSATPTRGGPTLVSPALDGLQTPQGGPSAHAEPLAGSTRNFVYLRDKPAFYQTARYSPVTRPQGKAPGEFKDKHSQPLDLKVDQGLVVRRGRKNPVANVDMPLKRLHEMDSAVPKRCRKQVEVYNVPSQRIERGKKTFVRFIHAASCP